MEKKGTQEQVKDFILKSEATEIVRDKLIGHKSSVNSLDIYTPQATNSGYLS
jgi:hypothetical protein